MSAKILVVDDEAPIRGVLEELLLSEGYTCKTAADAFEALEIFPQFRPDLMISDIRMPVMDGVQLLQKIREIDQDVSVVMITAVMEIEVAVNILKQGASDYITKPFNLHDVLDRVQSALAKRTQALEKKRYQEELEKQVKQRTDQLRNAFVELETNRNFTLEAMVIALDAREHETQAHSLRVRDYALALGREMNLSAESMVNLSDGALLHDVGKIGISDNILLKKGPLSPEEWIEMRRHPEIGHQILSGIAFLKKAISQIVLTHHEKYDGSGYPNRLAGDAIPLEARIFTLADTLDAITSDRPYRRAGSFDAAYQEIVRCQGSHFDPKVVAAFQRIPESHWQKIRIQAELTESQARPKIPSLQF